MRADGHRGGMPRRPSALSPELLAGPFTTRELLASGAALHRVRARDLTPVAFGIHRSHDDGGVRQPAAIGGWRPGEIAAYQRLVPHAVVSHLTAARVHGMILPAWVERELQVHLTFTAGPGRTRRGGMVAHRRAVPDGHAVVVGSLRVTTPARTLWDLCAFHPQLSETDLLVAADALLAPRWDEALGFVPGPHTRASLLGVLDQVGRFKGVRAARTVAARMRVGAASPQETRLRLGLVDAGLPEPQVQAQLHDDAARPGPVVDLAYRRWRIVLQYEGAHHRTREQQERDVRRDRWCAAHGWPVVKVIAADVATGLGDVVRQVRRLAAEAEGPG